MMTMTVRADPSPLDVETILAEITLDEPFDREADLMVVGYDGEEPLGLVAGRRVFTEDERPLALFEHVLVRPKWENGGHGLALANAWARLCVERGIRQAVCGIPKNKEWQKITRLALLWGFTPYAEDDDRVWYVKHLSERQGGGNDVL